MNPNLFASAINKVKANPKPLAHENETKEQEESKGVSDILSRIKKPGAAPSLVIKDQVGGRAQRLEKSVPYSRGKSEADIVTKALGSRFVPKAEIKWKHDLCPDQPTYRVFVRGLPMHTTYAALKDVFSKFGDITGIQVSLSRSCIG